jgi:hypothetical protein
MSRKLTDELLAHHAGRAQHSNVHPSPDAE